MAEMKAIFDSGLGNTLKIALPNVEKTPKILEAYWCDDAGAKTTTLAHKSKVYVKIKGSGIDGKKIKFEAYETDFGPMNDDFIHEHEWTFQGDSMTLSFIMTPEMFIKGDNEDLLYLYFTLAIGDNDSENYCYSDSEYLKVHLVRYVPGVLNALGWHVGEALQNEWFSRDATDDPDSGDPNLSIVKMNWVLGYARAKTVHDAMITNKVWVSAKGKPALVKKIKLMVTDEGLKLPKTVGDSTNFGVFDKTLTTFEDRQTPKFDKYHYQESAFKPGMWANLTTDLDDLVAALANFVFRMCVGGTITKTKTGYTVHVTQVATYVRDSFDFINPWYNDQDLGFWHIVDNKVGKTGGWGYREIENSSYQNYRDEFEIGGDYRLFSDLKFTSVNDSFHIPII